MPRARFSSTRPGYLRPPVLAASWSCTGRAWASALHRVAPRPHYTVEDRAKEIQQGRREGLLAGATVTWHPEPLDETLNWVLFGPGMYSQPLPVAYLPIWEFHRHGGPEAFGFAPFRSFAEIPHAHGMVAHITDTDVDLHRPGDDATEEEDPRQNLAPDQIETPGTSPISG